MGKKNATPLVATLSCLAVMLSAWVALPEDTPGGKMRELLPDGAACLLDIREGVVLAAGGEKLLLEREMPVGSLLKIFTGFSMLAAGESGNEVRFCPPSPPTVAATSACWYRPGHGNMTLKTALARSCNAYFRQWLKGKDLGPAERFMKELGLLKADLPSDPLERIMALTGLSPAVRPRPAGLISAAAALFNGGILYGISEAAAGERCDPLRTVRIDAEALATVREAMRECSANGTGRAVQKAVGLTPLLVKTGTSVHWSGEGADGSSTDGWCLVLYPTDKPRFLLLVFAPGATGSGRASEAAGEIMKAFLEGRNR